MSGDTIEVVRKGRKVHLRFDTEDVANEAFQLMEVMKRNFLAPEQLSEETDAMGSTPSSTFFRATVLKSFSGSEGDLHIRKGDLILVTNAEDNDYWEGVHQGRCGRFPKEYVPRFPCDRYQGTGLCIGRTDSTLQPR